MGESLIERRRVEEEALRGVNSFSSGRSRVATRHSNVKLKAKIVKVWYSPSGDYNPPKAVTKILHFDFCILILSAAQRHD